MLIRLAVIGQSLESQLREAESGRVGLQLSVEQLQRDVSALQSSLQQAQDERQSDAAAHRQRVSDANKALLGTSARRLHIHVQHWCILKKIQVMETCII